MFILIREYGLFSAVQEKALLLMEFDQYLYDLKKKEREETRAKAAAGDAPKDISGEDETPEPTADEELSKGLAVQLLVEHTDEIPVSSPTLVLGWQIYFPGAPLLTMFTFIPNAGQESCGPA